MMANQYNILEELNVIEVVSEKLQIRLVHSSNNSLYKVYRQNKI